MAQLSATHPKIRELADKLTTPKTIFDFVYKNVLYLPDKKGVQQLRFAHRSLRDKRGNCTDYAILISSLLLLNDIPHKLRIAGYTRPRRYEHIYIVLADGTVLDPVIGHAQDGSDTWENRSPAGSYNKEIDFKGKKDFNMPRLEILSGVRVGPDGSLGCSKCGGNCGGSLGLFCGKTCKCKNNCEGWFRADTTLKRGCKDICKASKGSRPTSAEAYCKTANGYMWQNGQCMPVTGFESGTGGGGINLPAGIYNPAGANPGAAAPPQSDNTIWWIAGGTLAALGIGATIYFATRKKKGGKSRRKRK